MLRLDEACVMVAVPQPEVADWIARGWVQPQGEPPDWLFAELDVARLRLVRDLRQDAGIASDSLALVLSLLDQMYATRRALQTLLAGLESQPAAVRAAVLGRLVQPTADRP